MPVINKASRKFAPKKRFLGFRTATAAIAVDMDVLAKKGVMHHEGEGHAYLIVYDQGLDTAWVFRGAPDQVSKELSVSDIDFAPPGPSASALNGLEPVNGFDVFWFAWYAFYPKTVVLDGNNP